MRTLPLFIALLFLVPPQASGQAGAWGDKIFGGEVTHDFGVQPRGAQLKYKFKMTNIYKVPLEITDVRVSCGCLTAQPSTKVLKPSETAWLTVNMDASRFVGPKTIRIFVTVGPEYVSTATLTVSANARSDVVFNPGEIDFGLVSRGQTPTRQIDVEYAGVLDWRVSDIVKSSTAPFELKVQDLPGEGARARGYRIFATLKSDAPPEKFKQEVILKTNDPSSPTLTFYILGHIQAPLSVSPAAIKVAGAKVGALETRQVVLRGSRPFRLVGVEGQGDGVTVTLPTTTASTHLVEIHFQPMRPGEVRRELTLRTDLDGGAVRVVVDGSGVD